MAAVLLMTNQFVRVCDETDVPFIIFCEGLQAHKRAK